MHFFGIPSADLPIQDSLSRSVSHVGIEQIGCLAAQSSDLGDAGERRKHRLKTSDLRVGKTTGTPRSPRSAVNGAVGEKQRRSEVVADLLGPEIGKQRKIDGAISVCEPATQGASRAADARESVVAEFRGLGNVEWSC